MKKNNNSLNKDDLSYWVSGIADAESSFLIKVAKDTTRKFSSNINRKLNPYYVSGFSDGEASFTVSIRENNKLKIGWVIAVAFQIHLDSKDINLLKQIKVFFGVGNISNNKDGSSTYSVTSVKDLINVIIPHFNEYSLITQKKADFELFKQVVYMMKDKKHLTIEGLHIIIGIKASMNKGLSDNLKSTFSTIIPAPRPLVINQEIKDINWFVGFVDAEGCFFVDIFKDATKSGFTARLVFKIGQHLRDEELMRYLINYLNCGQCKIRSDKYAIDFKVTKFSDIADKIIPIFTEYSLQGIKSFDFANFLKCAELIKNKAHLTIEGLDQIKKIKANMNTRNIGN